MLMTPFPKVTLPLPVLNCRLLFETVLLIAKSPFITTSPSLPQKKSQGEVGALLIMTLPLNVVNEPASKLICISLASPRLLTVVVPFIVVDAPGYRLI